MKIAAALCWYAESVYFLQRCIRSLEGIVDHVVAVDGPWEHFPRDGLLCSSATEQSAVRHAAEEIGASVEIHAPLGVWPSQVQKRDLMMRWAGEQADWILVVDADEYAAYSDPDKVRAELEATDCVIGEVTIKNLHRGGQLPGYHPDGGLTRRLYRAGTTVDVVHSGYFHNGQPLYRSEPTVDLRDHLRLEHDICNRGTARNQRSIAYREARERERVEVWV